MASKRLTVAKEARRTEVIQLYLEGKSQQVIADRFGVNRSTISKDLTAVREEWRKERTATVDQLRLIELAKIDNLEREAWEQFHRSKEAAVTTRSEIQTEMRPGKEAGQASERVPTAERLVRITEERTPDQKFMATIQWCIDQRCKICGLLAPTKIAPTTPDGSMSYVEVVKHLSDEELDVFCGVRDRLASAFTPSVN